MKMQIVHCLLLAIVSLSASIQGANMDEECLDNRFLIAYQNGDTKYIMTMATSTSSERYLTVAEYHYDDVSPAAGNDVPAQWKLCMYSDGTTQNLFTTLTNKQPIISSTCNKCSPQYHQLISPSAACCEETHFLQSLDETTEEVSMRTTDELDNRFSRLRDNLSTGQYIQIGGKDEARWLEVNTRNMEVTFQLSSSGDVFNIYPQAVLVSRSTASLSSEVLVALNRSRTRFMHVKYSRTSAKPQLEKHVKGSTGPEFTATLYKVFRLPSYNSSEFDVRYAIKLQQNRGSKKFITLDRDPDSTNTGAEKDVLFKNKYEGDVIKQMDPTKTIPVDSQMFYHREISGGLYRLESAVYPRYYMGVLKSRSRNKNPRLVVANPHKVTNNVRSQLYLDIQLNSIPPSLINDNTVPSAPPLEAFGVPNVLID